MKTKIVNYIFICLASFPYVANADTLRVTVNGVKAGEGSLRVAVCDEANRNDFPDGKFLLDAVVPATGNRMTVEFSDVDQGEYAVAVFQDLNENETLDKNFLGIPKEPYGFSGKWKSGGSTYDKALFNTDEVGFEITIMLK